MRVGNPRLEKCTATSCHSRDTFGHRSDTSFVVWSLVCLCERNICCWDGCMGWKGLLTCWGGPKECIMPPRVQVEISHFAHLLLRKKCEAHSSRLNRLWRRIPHGLLGKSSMQHWQEVKLATSIKSASHPLTRLYKKAVLAKLSIKNFVGLESSYTLKNYWAPIFADKSTMESVLISEALLKFSHRECPVSVLRERWYKKDCSLKLSNMYFGMYVCLFE